MVWQAVTVQKQKGRVNFMREAKKRVYRIVSMVLAFAMVITAVNTGGAQVQAKEKENVVILYFSGTGTTKGAAERIKKKTKGRLIEIKAANPYTDEDLNYGDSQSRVVQEHESADTPGESEVRPEISNLKGIKRAVKKADVVYIGYPIWWGEAPHIVYNLVENVSLRGKTVVPFATSISSGLGDSAENLKENAKISAKTNWLEGRNFYSIPSQKTVNSWINKLKY